MSGETDLKILLRGMEPVLDPLPHGLVTVSATDERKLEGAFAVIREKEGVTIVAPIQILQDANIATQESWALISLQIHSSLSAVGLTAAFTTALGNVGISANVIAGFFHDHILVQWDRRRDAMSALKSLSQTS